MIAALAIAAFRQYPTPVLIAHPRNFKKLPVNPAAMDPNLNGPARPALKAEADHRLVEPALLWFLLLAFALLAFRALVINSPTLASDEYAYFVAGQYFPNYAVPHRFDPFLQAAAGRLYFFIVHQWFLAGPLLAAKVGQLWNTLVYCSGALLVYLATAKAFGRRTGMATAIVYLAMPMSVYASTTLPEADYQFVFYAIVVVFTYFWPQRPWVVAVAGGVLLACLLLIKPNALSIYAAVVLAMVISPAIGYSPRVRWPSALLAAGLCTLAFYLSVALLWRILGSAWSFNPMDWVGGIYTGYLTHGLNVARSLATSALSLRYGFAHISILAMLLPMGVVAVLVWLWRECRIPQDGASVANPARTSLLLLLVSSVVTVVAMIARFTVSAGGETVAENGRLHGRYLLHLLPFLAAPLFAVNWREEQNLIRAAAILGLIALAVYVFWIIPNFKIYPWDYPELFALYHYPNRYAWGWTWSFQEVGRVLLAIGFLACVTAAVWPRRGQFALIAYLIAVFGAGQLQENAWLFSFLSSMKPLTDAARAARVLLERVPAGSGVVIGEHRFQAMSFVLMGLASAPHVMEEAEGTKITAAMLPPGAQWLLLTTNYVVSIPYRSMTQIGPLELYRLTPGPPTVDVPAPRVWNEKPIRIDFGLGGDVDRLIGFNTPEAWGAWTATNPAYIRLPAFVGGRLTLKLRAWTVPQNLSVPLRVEVGRQAVKLQLTSKPQSYEIHLDVGAPASRVEVSMPSYRAHPWERALGVALADLEISRE